MRKKLNNDAPFQSVRGAAYITGLSAAYIRAGCKDGSIPCIKVGAEYRVNMPVWRAQLNTQSAACAHGGGPI